MSYSAIFPDAPPLWWHQRLPNSGVSFAQGMRSGLRPDAMIAELQAMWARDAAESAVVEALFKNLPGDKQ